MNDLVADVIAAYERHLSDHGFAVVQLPEGVEVAHGSKLVKLLPWSGKFYLVPPESP